MRQVFSSPRLENVERLGQILAEAGIRTKVSNHPMWRRATKRDFSYTDRTAGAWPALWVLDAEDFSRARDILRDCGLLESTRPGESSYLPPPVPGEVATPQAGARRARWILFLVIALVAGLVAWRMAGIL
jgi:hypothetical protein